MIVSDWVTNGIHSLYVENTERIAERFDQTTIKIVAEHKRLLVGAPETPDDCMKLLEEHAQWLERSMRQVLKRHSPLFWLSVERRFPPWLQLGNMNTAPGQEMHLLRDTRQLMTALILKHSSWDIRDWEPSPDGTFYIEPNSSDIVDLWGYLLKLFYEASNISIVYRRAAKGARLGEGEDGKLQATFPPQMERSVQLYQKRRQAFGFTLSPVGTGGGLVAAHADNPMDYRDDNWRLIFFDYNEDQDFEYALAGLAGKVRGPGFIPKFILLEDLFRFLRPFGEKVEAVSGLTLDELRLSLVSLKNYVTDVFAGPGAYTCLKRGMVFSEEGWLLNKLQSNLARASKAEGESIAVEKVTQMFLNLLACKPEQLNGYDLLLRKGCGCLIKQDNLIVIDLTLVPLILGDMLIDLELDDEMRRIKGSHYEDMVVEQLKVDVPKLTFPISPGTALRREQERNPFAQADVYIGLDRFLVMVDCKAWSLPRGYFKGERREVEKRLDIVREWQSTNDKRAIKLRSGRTGSNYQIPAHITHCVPIVCSATPEFIWGFEENDFLSDEIPRVASYPELVNFLRGFDVEAMLKKPFAVPID